MREILFRAKSVATGNWVYGDLYSRGAPSIYSNGERLSVDKYTIGQYIGLTDKNGTKIFEGDFLTNVYLNPQKITPLHIHFDEYCACYRAGRFQIDKNCCLNYTIIGNIYDNPELLK